MGVSLSKGQTVSLQKGGRGLSSVFMGLGWDAAAPKKTGGFLAGLFGGGSASAPPAIDLDASVMLFDSNAREIEVVSFRQLQSSDRAIRHMGDNLTGEGDGDDEVIKVDLSALKPEVEHLVFLVNSFRGQTFNEVDNASCRLVDDVTGEEICSFKLTEQGGHTGVVMASISRKDGAWVMKAHGIPATGRTAQDMLAVAVNAITRA